MTIYEICGIASSLPHLTKPEVPWVIVTIIGLSYVHNLWCVTVEVNKKKLSLSKLLIYRTIIGLFLPVRGKPAQFSGNERRGVSFAEAS